MRINFKAIQEIYPDALDFKIQLANSSRPCGQQQLQKLAGGGKVLHYSHKGSRERIIVSRLAENEITVVYGPQGSGKTHFVENKMLNEYRADEIVRCTLYTLPEANIVPATTKVVFIDEFPGCAQFSRMQQQFICEPNAAKLNVRIIVAIQSKRPPYASYAKAGVITLVNVAEALGTP